MTSPNPAFRDWDASEPVAPGDPMGFSCRGCGHLCCVNKTIILAPPEATRIVWFLQRHPEKSAALASRGGRWASASVSAVTGLPTLQLTFMPFDAARPQLGAHCVFLSPVFEGAAGGLRYSGVAECAIHAARPSACRIFPLGLLRTSEARAEYRVVERCPGFSPAQPGEPVWEGYRPPDPAVTVQAWAEQQLLREQTHEREWYFTEVVPAFQARDMHATTDDAPGGRLGDEDVLELVALFFGPPPRPDDPRDDHAAIMRWLEWLRDQADVVAARYQAD